ncbi:hypothetical protein U1872_16720 [Sphingomonas sp. RB3P16]|uniref:ArnT family glycosyltransferase n=1 Tax=Parasphingomonas frigoris TaxID=3096163 RepID=UPI002FCBB707
MAEPVALSIRPSALRGTRAIPRWAILFVVAALVRAVTFGNPIVHVDEEFYFTAARAILRGATLYSDVWDRKPVGLFLLYMPAAALGVPLGIWAYQAMALASVTATAALIAHLAQRAGWARGALPAGLAYLLWLNLLGGEGGQTPVFYNLLVASAASLLAPRPDDARSRTGRFRAGCAAMALVGLALQIKYTVVFEGLFFGMWWMWRERRFGVSRRNVVLAALPLMLLTALPTIAAWGWFAAHGHGDAFRYANFESIGARGSDPLERQIGNFVLLLLILSPLIAMTTLAARLAPTRPGLARQRDAAQVMRRWLLVWAIVAGLAVLLFGAYFDHYGLPLLVPLCACSAGFFAAHRRAAQVTKPLLLLVLLGSQATVLIKRHTRGTPTELGAITQAIGRGPGCLFVFSGSSIHYALADRCTPTRYQFSSHLVSQRERPAIGVDQRGELARVLAQRPAIIVVGPAHFGDREDLRAWFVARVRATYRETADLPLGNRRVRVYALR